MYQGSSRVANHESVSILILVKERDVVHEVFKHVDISTCYADKSILAVVTRESR